MMMPPLLRNLALIIHVAASVGWMGAVTMFLVLGIVGLTTPDPLRVQAVYLAMEISTSVVIVPLCLASLVTGIIQSLGTTWGLVRHYWVVIKLIITVLATIILFIHTQPIADVARAAATAPLANGDLRAVRIQITVDAGAALLALLVTTALSIIKPRGVTPYGFRRLQAQRQQAATADRVSRSD
ncbi:MAG TPA: hypothetical protein VGE07_06470 [Herpetosiphonaceae bacterium]